MMYGKSDKQYFVLPRGGQDMKLVTNPEFRERESGYCLKPFQWQQPPRSDEPDGPTPMAIDRPLPPAQQEAPARGPDQPDPMPIEIPAEREAREKEPTERPSYRQAIVSDSNEIEEGPAPERPDTGSMTDKPSELLEVEKNGETSSPHGSVMDKPRKPSEVEKHGETPWVGETSSPQGVAGKPSKLPEFQLEGERRDDVVHLGRRDNKLPGVAP